MKTKIKDEKICQICSFPKELCICEKLGAEDQQIEIYNEKRRWGKKVTIAKFNGNFNIDLDNLITRAKKKCASGGTYGDNYIEVQGDHRFRLKKFLINEGFPKEKILIED
ncbi:MAG: stress response translation initiation inhibitor YciH [Candidatus Hodarchaeota archaeon]